MALGLRMGLAGLAETGDVLAARDWNQNVRMLAAMRSVVALLLGGEGVYLGLDDDPTGAVAASAAAPLVIAVADDGGFVHWFALWEPAAIAFEGAEGAYSLYAVVEQEAGVSPAAAIGGTSAVSFVAATAAPPHSLLLGTGTVAGGEFVTWMPSSESRVGRSPLAARLLADADGDTTVSVEATPDDDAVRLACGGAVRASLSATALEVAVDLSVTGDTALGGGADAIIDCTGCLLLRQVDDSSMTATAGTRRELVYNAADNRVYACTTSGSPAAWLAL